jgi:hypothetical protein
LVTSEGKDITIKPKTEHDFAMWLFALRSSRRKSKRISRDIAIEGGMSQTNVKPSLNSQRESLPLAPAVEETHSRSHVSHLSGLSAQKSSVLSTASVTSESAVQGAKGITSLSKYRDAFKSPTKSTKSATLPRNFKLYSTMQFHWAAIPLNDPLRPPPGLKANEFFPVFVEHQPRVQLMQRRQPNKKLAKIAILPLPSKPTHKLELKTKAKRPKSVNVAPMKENPSSSSQGSSNGTPFPESATKDQPRQALAQRNLRTIPNIHLAVPPPERRTSLAANVKTRFPPNYRISDPPKRDPFVKEVRSPYPQRSSHMGFVAPLSFTQDLEDAKAQGENPQSFIKLQFPEESNLQNREIKNSNGLVGNQDAAEPSDSLEINSTTLPNKIGKPIVKVPLPPQLPVLQRNRMRDEMGRNGRAGVPLTRAYSGNAIHELVRENEEERAPGDISILRMWRALGLG